MAINPALIGNAGERLVAAEMMRRGIEIALPAADVGVDLLAYRRPPEQNIPRRFVPIQVKARSASGYNFQKVWFERVRGVVLVQVWHVQTTPEFYVFANLSQVEDALGPIHAASPSWRKNGGYSVTTAGPDAYTRMQNHRNQWDRIIRQL